MLKGYKDLVLYLIGAVASTLSGELLSLLYVGIAALAVYRLSRYFFRGHL